MSQAQQLDDVAFLKDSNGWPCWPWCPVKTYAKQADNSPKIGIVSYTHPTTVFETNMFKPDFTNCVKHKYNSIEELCKEWMVD